MVGEVLYVSQEIGETSPYWLTVIQGEHDYRTIVLTPLINGEIADINGMYSYIESTKTDGYSYMIPCTIENNTIIIAIKEQMTTTVGKYTADVNIEGVGVRETALTIRFTVRASSADDASILSQNDFAVLDSMDSRFAETMKTYIDSNYDLSGQSAAASASAASAAESASQAAQSATNAAESERLSGISATAAEQSATNANTANTDAQAARDATITARTGAETARDAAVTAKTAAEAARDRTITEAESIYTIQHAPPMASLYTAIILETPTLGVL